MLPDANVKLTIRLAHCQFRVTMRQRSLQTIRRMWCLTVVLLLTAALLVPGSTNAAQGDEPVVRQAIESVLEMDTGRQAARLPRVTFDESKGDLTVVFAMRRPASDDPAQIVASATDDVFTILWAAYASGPASRIQTVTVLGTYAVVGRYARPREVPLVRAVLTADRAASLDWTNVASADPGSLLDVWWVEGEVGGYTPGIDTGSFPSARAAPNSTAVRAFIDGASAL